MNAPTALQCASCPVRDRAACATLNEDERAELARLGRKRRLAKGETLFAAGDDSDLCATLTRGALKIATHGEDGVERILSLVHPAGFVGELFSPLESHDVIALTESELCLFSQRDFDAALERFPKLARSLLRRANEDLYSARALLELQGRRNAKGRVAAFLLAMARAASDSPCHPADQFELPLSRGDLAGMIGLTIETVSRQITALERDGLIERSGPRGIKLRDPQGLAVLAG